MKTQRVNPKLRCFAITFLAALFLVGNTLMFPSDALPLPGPDPKSKQLWNEAVASAVKGDLDTAKQIISVCDEGLDAHQTTNFETHLRKLQKANPGIFAQAAKEELGDKWKVIIPYLLHDAPEPERKDIKAAFKRVPKKHRGHSDAQDFLQEIEDRLAQT